MGKSSDACIANLNNGKGVFPLHNLNTKKPAIAEPSEHPKQAITVMSVQLLIRHMLF